MYSSSVEFPPSLLLEPLELVLVSYWYSSMAFSRLSLDDIFWKDQKTYKTREEGIPGSKTNEGYEREEIPRREMSKNENLRNAEGNGGIPLFIGDWPGHIKWHNQSGDDTWRSPRRNESTRLITNKKVTRGTSTHMHLGKRRQVIPLYLDDPYEQGGNWCHKKHPTPELVHMARPTRDKLGQTGQTKWWS